MRRSRSEAPRQKFSQILANRVRGRVLGGLIVVSAACALAPGAALAGTLDQQQTNTGNLSQRIDSTHSEAQTFTPSLTGGVDQVDLFLDTTGTPTAPLSAEIRNVDSMGKPGTTPALATRSVPAFSLASPGFVTINFASPAPVVAGTQYAIVASSATDSGNPYAWVLSDSGATLNPYKGGEPFVLSPLSGAWTAIGTGQDFAFRTYVVPAPTQPSAKPTGTPGTTCKGQQATIVGTEGNDVRSGTPGRDVMVGLGGNDSLSGLGGNDLICGGSGKDKLKGGGGKDVCKGGKGNDSAATCEVEKSI